jgi:hypothetical protein
MFIGFMKAFRNKSFKYFAFVYLTPSGFEPEFSA